MKMTSYFRRSMMYNPLQRHHVSRTVQYNKTDCTAESFKISSVQELWKRISAYKEWTRFIML